MKEAELLQEFTKRAKACGLEVDCLSSGRLDSEICVISEAPGEHEATMKMPMVGGAGKMLWDTLRLIDISRTDCYVTNVVKKQVSLSSKTDARSPVRRLKLNIGRVFLTWNSINSPTYDTSFALETLLSTLSLETQVLLNGEDQYLIVKLDEKLG